MVQELAAMQRRMDSNQTLEEAMRDFAERSGIPEAETFAEIFTMGKRSGGDLIEIMEDTARTIAQTVETERAIAATLASRRYEQKIMNGIPFVIVLYLRIGCPGFMDPVYGNNVGVCVMTAACFCIWAPGIWEGECWKSRCSMKLLEKLNRRLLGKAGNGYPGKENVAGKFSDITCRRKM